MRFKYKIYIIVFTVLIMFIGLGTFSLIAPSIEFSSENEVNIGVKEEDKKPVATEKNNTEEITELIKGYFSAKQKVDMNAIASYVSDSTKIEEKRLMAEAEYIEDYRNIACTIKKASEEGAYRVYVYYDVKVYDIETLIPSLVAFYVKSDNYGSYKIYLGEITPAEQESIDKLDESDDVKEMKESVQKNLESLISTDSNVKKFYEKLEETDSSNESKENNTDIDKEGSKSNTKSKSK